MLVPLAIAVAGVMWPPLARREVTHSLLVVARGGDAARPAAVHRRGAEPDPGAWLADADAIARGGLPVAARARRHEPVHRVRPGPPADSAGRPDGRSACGSGWPSRRPSPSSRAASSRGGRVANDLSLRDVDRPSIASRFGPTDLGPTSRRRSCDGPLASGERVGLLAHFAGPSTGRPSGSVDLAGQRSGADFRWLAYVATDRQLGQHGQARLGERPGSARRRAAGSGPCPGWRPDRRSTCRPSQRH